MFLFSLLSHYHPLGKPCSYYPAFVCTELPMTSVPGVQQNEPGQTSSSLCSHTAELCDLGQTTDFSACRFPPPAAWQYNSCLLGDLWMMASCYMNEPSYLLFHWSFVWLKAADFISSERLPLFTPSYISRTLKGKDGLLWLIGPTPWRPRVNSKFLAVPPMSCCNPKQVTLSPRAPKRKLCGAALWKCMGVQHLTQWGHTFTWGL